MSNQYWVVGASWGGVEMQDERFVKGGFWVLGWRESDSQNAAMQVQRAQGMKRGDRIAIKRMRGKQQTGIRIMHIGIIQDVIHDTDKVVCTVNWVSTNLNRDIDESRGCFASVHGPYEHDAWIEKIFCI